jgi:hypothetical protein
MVSSADPTIGKRFVLRTLAALAVFWLGPSHVDLAASQPVVDRDAFLSAVAEIETGGNARAVGRRGERGLYQFTRATWQRHSSRPFVDAHDPVIAHAVAVRHFKWLQDKIATSGREATSYRLAVAWNAGLSRALSGSAPRSTRDYARRVSNLASVLRPPNRSKLSPSATVVAVNTPTRVSSFGSLPPVTNTEPAPDVVPIAVSLGGSDDVALTGTDAEPAAAPAEEISFTLARPAATNATPPRRFIFATIGE